MFPLWLDSLFLPAVRKGQANMIQVLFIYFSGLYLYFVCISRWWRSATPTRTEYWTLKSSHSIYELMKSNSKSCFATWIETTTVCSRPQCTFGHLCLGSVTEKGFLSLLLCVPAGQIDAAEIQHSLRTIGVNISLADAKRILKRSANSVLMSGLTTR